MISNWKEQWSYAIGSMLLFFCLSVWLSGCSSKEEPVTFATPQVVSETLKPTSLQEEYFEEAGERFQVVCEEVYTTSKLNVREQCSTDSKIIKMLPERAKVVRVGVGESWSKISTDLGEYYVVNKYLTTEEPIFQGILIAIDAGHQEHENLEQEPVGPNAEETKAKVTTGTKGVRSGQYEYQLTLAVALSLKEELLERGYDVFMVRESNDVNLSNRERAQLVTDSGAQICIRLHANGSKVQETNGVMAICGSKDSPYVGHLYEESRALSENILLGFIEKTGAQNKGIWETDTMVGINWSTVPVTVVEMGFMSNPEEDEKMNTPEYQKNMVCGIADGIDQYMGQEKGSPTNETKGEE